MASSSHYDKAGEDVAPLSYKRSWIVWGCAALFYCYQFLLRVSPSIMADDLMASFQIDACTLGIISGFYYYTYSTFQVPGGAFLDSFKPRRVLSTAVLICSIGTLVFSMADNIYLAACGRALIGAGSALGFLSCFKIGSIWFPTHQLPLIVGLTILLGTVGAVSAGYPLAWLLSLYGWRETLWLFAISGLVLAVLGWTVVRDVPPASLENEILKSHGETSQHVPAASLRGSIMEVIRKPQSWIIGFYGFCLYIPLSGVTDIWGPPFLMAAYGVDKPTAGALNSALYVGLGLGAPLFSVLASFLKAYKPAVFISAFGALIMLSIVYYVPDMSIWLLALCLFLGGFFLGGQFLGFSMASAINPLSAAGTAGGFHNVFCMLSGVICQPLLGWLLDLSWQGTCTNGVRLYTLSQYMLAFSPIVSALGLACIVVLFIKETY